MTDLPLWRRLLGAALMLVALVLVVTLCLLSFTGSFKKTVDIVVTSERAGLILNPGAKVKVDGVEVGRVKELQSEGGKARLVLAIEENRASGIPANSGANIAATTVFGSKFVELTPPVDAPRGRLRGGEVISASNVTTEVNTVFQNIVDVTNAVDVDKLKSALGALAEGLRGQGAELGNTINQFNEILVRFNAEMPTFTDDVRRSARVAELYADLGPQLVTLLDTGATTSNTIVRHAADLDRLLMSAIGFGNEGSAVLGENKEDAITLIHNLVPTTALLEKYQAVLGCLPHESVVDLARVDRMGAGNTGYSLDLDVSLNLGDDAYKYPENLPKVAAKGGPNGEPGCYPTITEKNFPAPYLVMNTGAILTGTGTYTPRIGNPIFADYLFGNVGGGR
ncbi:MCE family protein [Williamsia sp. DF01-3]|uniref:MCE family protein n=1 Tax=Williamsia sp. DF01-3 TaxID=2934157 RepID=UPI001FF43C4B|nr:MCE family protein [Williamsia sp. DF01-3]MCK0516767.1 MCE family protein [Williamsia sp. DF01-3]